MAAAGGGHQVGGPDRAKGIGVQGRDPGCRDLARGQIVGGGEAQVGSRDHDAYPPERDDRQIFNAGQGAIRRAIVDDEDFLRGHRLVAKRLQTAAQQRAAIEVHDYDADGGHDRHDRDPSFALLARLRELPKVVVIL